MSYNSDQHSNNNMNGVDAYHTDNTDNAIHQQHHNTELPQSIVKSINSYHNIQQANDNTINNMYSLNKQSNDTEMSIDQHQPQLQTNNQHNNNTNTDDTVVSSNKVLHDTVTLPTPNGDINNVSIHDNIDKIDNKITNANLPRQHTEQLNIKQDKVDTDSNNNNNTVQQQSTATQQAIKVEHNATQPQPQSQSPSSNQHVVVAQAVVVSPNNTSSSQQQQQQHTNNIPTATIALSQQQQPQQPAQPVYNPIPSDFQPLHVQQLTLNDLPPRCRMHSASMSICLPWCQKRWRENNALCPPTDAFDEIRKQLKQSIYGIKDNNQFKRNDVLNFYNKPVDISQWNNIETLYNNATVKQCIKCKKYRYIQQQELNDNDNVKQEHSNNDFTCTQNTDIQYSTCESSEHLFPGRIVALDNYRIVGPYNYTLLGILPFVDDVYNAIYTHKDWTKYETIVLLEQCRIYNIYDWSSIYDHPVLHVRQTIQTCQQRLLHILTLASLYCQTITRYGIQYIKQLTPQIIQQAIQHTSNNLLQSSNTRQSTRQSTNRRSTINNNNSITPTNISNKRQSKLSKKDNEETYHASGSTYTQANRLSTRTTSRTATQKRVKYTFDSDDDLDDIDNDSKTSISQQQQEPQYAGKIERILAQRTRKAKIDNDGNIIEYIDDKQHHATIDDTLKRLNIAIFISSHISWLVSHVHCIYDKPCHLTRYCSIDLLLSFIVRCAIIRSTCV